MEFYLRRVCNQRGYPVYLYVICILRIIRERFQNKFKVMTFANKKMFPDLVLGNNKILVSEIFIAQTTLSVLAIFAEGRRGFLPFL